MNERIKELGRQASLWCDQNIPGEFSEETMGYGHYWQEKFAELIIQECVKIAYQNDIAKFTRDGYQIGMDIQKHFGVEE